MDNVTRDGRGSAVRWFALATLMLSVASVAGAHTLDWLTQSGHVAVVAYREPVPATNARAAADAGVDTMPVGSIPSKALMIRIR